MARTKKVAKDQKRILSKEEQETVITFNKAEAHAEIFTYEYRWIKGLEDKLGLKPVSDNGWGGRTYHLPKAWVKLPRKIGTRVMSDEQRKITSDRFKKLRKSKKAE